MSLAEEWDKIPSSPGGSAAPKSLVSDWDAVPSVQDVPRGTEPKYLNRLGGAVSRFQSAVDKDNRLLTAPKAAGEVALATVTGAPVSLLKHAVEEGAYLSGQTPEAATKTSERVIPFDGYQPKSEAGQALAETAGTLIEPVVNAGKWVAGKLGFSPAFQNLAGDFAPVVAPSVIKQTGQAVAHPFQTASKVANQMGAALDTAKGTAQVGLDVAKQGSIQGMKGRFQQLVDQGNAPPTTVTPQMLRGQEPIPEQLSVPVEKAPEVSLENASPELKATVENAPQVNPTALQRHLEADSLPVRMQLSEGQATGDIHQLSNEFNLRGRRPEIAQLFNRQNQDLISNLNAIRDRAAPNATALDHVENGEGLIKAYQVKDAALKEGINAKYQALRDAAGGDFPVDAKTLYGNIEQALGKELLTYDAPASQMASLKALAEKGQMTYENFLSLRKNLSKVARTATDGNTRVAAGIMIQELENLPLRPEVANLQPLANEARAAAKARFDLIDKDPAYKAVVNDKIPADKFVQKFVVNGTKSDVATMQEFLKDVPQARENIAAGSLNYLKSRAGIVNDNGNFSQAGYNKALDQLRPKLDYLFDPVTAQQAQTLGNVARYTIQQPRGSYFNNSNTFVAAAKEMGMGALNAKTYGISGMVENAVKTGKEAKMASEATKPGAGIKLKDINP